MSKKYIINFFGGPGSGKSTAMAYVFAGLKLAGINCEMCLESVKFIFYEKNTNAFSNQIYIFGQQSYKQTTLAKEAEVVVTDAPLLNSIIYNNLKAGREQFDSLIFQKFNEFNNINYFLNRYADYSTFGRHQNQEQANEIGQETKNMLVKYGVDFTETTSKKENLDVIVEEIIKMVKQK